MFCSRFNKVELFKFKHPTLEGQNFMIVFFDEEKIQGILRVRIEDLPEIKRKLNIFPEAVPTLPETIEKLIEEFGKLVKEKC